MNLAAMEWAGQRAMWSAVARHRFPAPCRGYDGGV